MAVLLLLLLLVEEKRAPATTRKFVVLANLRDTVIVPSSIK